MSDKILVVVPTFNNPKTIKNVADDILNHGYMPLIVDDGSEIAIETLFDESYNEKIILLRHEKNSGKGSAIHTGALKAKELGHTFFVSMDGDGQHLASEISKLLDVYVEDSIVIGARNFDLDHVPNGSKFGRWFSNFWACWDTGFEITDSLSGFRIYPVSIVDLPIKTKEYDWEMEVIVRHAWAGKNIVETVIECYYPTPDERVSHFRKFGDTMAIVWVHVQMLPIRWIKKLLRLN